MYNLKTLAIQLPTFVQGIKEASMVFGENENNNVKLSYISMSYDLKSYDLSMLLIWE